MDRNSVFLKYIFISVTIFALTNCSRQKKEENEYINVDWIPSNKDISGMYMLDRNYHDDLPKDSIFLKFNDDSTFIAKNFFYSEFGWDSIRPIPYAEGIWLIEKSEGNSTEKINLIFNDKFNQYNGIDDFKNKKNIFLKIAEMQMNKIDSLFLFTIFGGDPDHSKFIYNYYQESEITSHGQKQ